MLSAPINLSLLKEILLVLFSAIGSIIAIVMFFQQKDRNEMEGSSETNRKRKQRWFKPLVVFCAVILTVYVLISSYLVYVNRDRFSADLVIDIKEPYMISVNGTEKDAFVVDADYCVISEQGGFSVDAKINLHNIYTGENYSFRTYNLGDGYRIADFPSGIYDVTIDTKEYELYSERIQLDRSNIIYDDGNNTWLFTAYAFDTFRDGLVKAAIYLGDNRENIEIYAFSVSGGDEHACRIFYSDVDWNDNAKLEGYFMGYPGTYEVNNAINTTTMEPVTIVFPEKS